MRTLVAWRYAALNCTRDNEFTIPNPSMTGFTFLWVKLN